MILQDGSKLSEITVKGTKSLSLEPKLNLCLVDGMKVVDHGSLVLKNTIKPVYKIEYTYTSTVLGKECNYKYTNIIYFNSRSRKNKFGVARIESPSYFEKYSPMINLRGGYNTLEEAIKDLDNNYSGDKIKNLKRKASDAKIEAKYIKNIAING